MCQMIKQSGCSSHSQVHISSTPHTLAQITWLYQLLLNTPQVPQQQQHPELDAKELVFSLIPDYVLSDSLSWLSFVIRRSVQLSALCVKLMQCLCHAACCFICSYFISIAACILWFVLVGPVRLRLMPKGSNQPH